MTRLTMKDSSTAFTCRARSRPGRCRASTRTDERQRRPSRGRASAHLNRHSNTLAVSTSPRRIRSSRASSRHFPVVVRVHLGALKKPHARVLRRALAAVAGEAQALPGAGNLAGLRDRRAQAAAACIRVGSRRASRRRAGARVDGRAGRGGGRRRDCAEDHRRASGGPAGHLEIWGSSETTDRVGPETAIELRQRQTMTASRNQHKHRPRRRKHSNSMVVQSVRNSRTAASQVHHLSRVDILAQAA
jgi:hypothetical protein